MKLPRYIVIALAFVGVLCFLVYFKVKASTPYYMRADGTAASKAAATSCSAASTAMSIPTHNSQTFSAGDSIVLCDSGGTYAANVALTPPSSGSSGSPITYMNSGAPVIDGSTAVTGWSLYSGTAGAWANGYLYRATATIASGQVTGTLTNYPALISLSANNLKTVATYGGAIQHTVTQTVGTYSLTVPADFLVTSDSAGSVPITGVEFESYSASAGTALVWVLVPSAAVGTSIYIWYGNASVSTLQGTPANVWAAYNAVWHLPNGTTLNASSSTGANNGTINSATAHAGEIDGAAAFSGSSQDISVSAITALAGASKAVLSGWFNSLGGQRMSFGQDSGANGTQFMVTCSATPLCYVQADSLTNYAYGSFTPPADSNFHYVVAIFDGTQTGNAARLVVYLDNVQQTLAFTGTIPATLHATAAAFYLGYGPLDGWYNTGYMDEVRLSTGATYGAAQAGADYLNQGAPGTFWTITYDGTSGTCSASCIWSAPYTWIMPNGANSPGGLFINGTPGTQELALGSLTTNNEWYYTANTIYLYSTPTNPVSETVLAATYNCIWLVGRSYLNFSNIATTHGVTGVYVDSSNYINVNNASILFNGGSGVEVSNGSTNVTFTGGVVHDNGWVQGGDDNGFAIGDIGNASSNTTVSGVLMYNNGNPQVEIAPPTLGGAVTGTVIKYCQILNGRTSGIKISGNVAATATFFGNVIAGNAEHGIIGEETARTDTAFNIYGNTIYGNQWDCLDLLGTTVTFENNICSGNAITGGWYEVQTDSYAVLTSNYNDFYHAAGGSFMYYQTTAYSFSGWKTASSQDANSISANPLFANSASQWWLTPGSPGIAAGTPLGSPYNIGLVPGSTWPDRVTTQTANTPPDLGAYVYNGVGAINATVGGAATTGGTATIQ